MAGKAVVAIIDVGKTNKKIFLLDENYHIVYERTAKFAETVDEDGDNCENIESLKRSLFDYLKQVMAMPEYDVRAVNFSTYGASFVYLDEEGKELTPLYNYLKVFPEGLEKQFYENYGGKKAVSTATASPVLGSLNSGLQVYRLKHEQPDKYAQLKAAVHLPQYLSFLLTGKAVTDMTSIGCHTQLWDFNSNEYHRWVLVEGLDEKFGEIKPAYHLVNQEINGKNLKVGIGLHDSSSALIPYLENFNHTFLLLSTGTWCIAMNPFNQKPLTQSELEQDCLCYIQYQGTPVKSSRLFAGQEHEDEAERIAKHFGVNSSYYKDYRYNPVVVGKLKKLVPDNIYPAESFDFKSDFGKRDLNIFENPEQAYHQLIMDLIKRQIYSLDLVLSSEVTKIFVDGGFSKNDIYMHMLAKAYPKLEVYASIVAQASAVGAALAIHSGWNSKPIPTDLISLTYYGNR